MYDTPHLLEREKCARGTHPPASVDVARVSLRVSPGCLLPLFFPPRFPASRPPANFNPRACERRRFATCASRPRFAKTRRDVITPRRAVYTRFRVFPPSLLVFPSAPFRAFVPLPLLRKIHSNLYDFDDFIVRCWSQIRENNSYV